MKRIAIISKRYALGGVEKALVELLRNVDCTKYEIDLYLPEFTEGIYPENINQIKMKSLFEDFSLGYCVTHPMQILCAATSVVKNKIWKKRSYIQQLLENKYSYRKNETEYDLAIAYDGPLGFSIFYTIYNIKARKKYFWIHGSVVGDKICKDIVEKYYFKFDKMIFVSKSIMQEYATEYPKCSENTTYFYNFINSESILKQAMEPVDDVIKKEKYIITTVARLSKEKGVDLAIKTSCLLRDMGFDFQWIIIGGGNEYASLKKMICDNELQDYCLLLGEKENPYPYMKACDVYVQPSRTEGFCTTTNEAKILGKPVIATDVGGMREQFIHNETGIIVSPENCEEMAQAIVTLCTDENLENRIRANLSATTKFGDIKELSTILG